MILEIRTYRIRPGRLDDFVAAVSSAQPLLERYGIDVVRAGPSRVPDDGDHAYLIRAFRSLDERDRQEAAFYGSRDWHDGPRAAVLEPIESYHTVVLELDETAVDAFRR